ncbi:hypothetical protein [Catelliglobosispora koreensis]|uniref:hypothetical protein n=1 Tax=Catelliglobosispora koreensis TaxID=129052 RepID=UPI0003651C7D|nr:hypothetical protein [Catelliglobosispora koreensis]
MARHPSIPSWTEVLDAATYSAAIRRRRRVQLWLVRHPKTRITLRIARGVWRRKHYAVRPILTAMDWLYDHGSLRAQPWRRNDTRTRTRTQHTYEDDYVPCTKCGRMVRAKNARAHLAWHMQWDGRTNPITARRGYRKVWETTDFPVSAPPAPNAPSSSATGKPASVKGVHHRMSTTTTHLKPLMNAAKELSEMEPATAWELDAQLVGLSRGAVAIADAIGDYAETLDTTHIDQRVSAHVLTAMENLVQAGSAFANAATSFRTLYAAHLEAAEAGVRQPTAAGFFDPKNAA